MDGNNRRWLPDGRKETQRPENIENVKTKIHARARKVLQHGIGNFVWASGSGGKKVGGSCKKFSEMEDLASSSAREVKRAAVEEREETSIPLQKDSESQSRRQSHPSEPSEVE